MKLNYKHKEGRELVHMDIIDLDSDHDDINDIDKETQRLKWRIYKRRYRQKKRRNAMNMKQASSSQRSKSKAKVISSKSNLVNEDRKEVSSCTLRSNSAQERENKKKIQKQVIPLKKEEKRTEIHQMSANVSEEVNREVIREKWRLYKRNYRQKKRNNVLPHTDHLPNVPKIVEEDTAIYFVEENSTNHEYMYEDDFSEGEHEYQCKSDELSDSYEIIEINESFDELITVKCEPSDFIECVLKPTQSFEN